MTGEPFVKFVPLMIPGGLANNDTFWIDLNKGVRALYFPARYKYSNDFPQDAAYAKISFVEGGTRNLIDGSQLIFENTIDKFFGGKGIDLTAITQNNANSLPLNKQYHLGAYSFDSTIVVNVPQFIESCYFVSTNPSIRPYNSIYLAKSADIKATRVPPADSWDNWHLPSGVYSWVRDMPGLMTSYSAELSRSEQINLIESQTSDIGVGTEFGVNILLMGASMIPYVGPLIAAGGTIMLDKMKNLNTDSSAEDAQAVGIAGSVWSSIPGEAKDQVVAKIGAALTKIARALHK